MALGLFAQDDVDNGIDVGDVDLSVLVNVGATLKIIGASCTQDYVDYAIDVGNVHLAVTVHITLGISTLDEDG